MKETEKILGLIALIGLIFKILMFPFGGLLLTLSLSTLAICYYLSFAFLNDIPLKNIFKKESYSGISPLKMIGIIGFGFALSAISIGVLFYLQFWPGSRNQLLSGLVCLLPILVVATIRFIKNKSGFYKRIFTRTLIFGGLCVLLLLTPPIVVFGIFHRDNPDYVEAARKSWADPQNKELRKALERERELNLNGK